MKSPRIIIAAPSYDSSVGGSIVLHKLCDILLTLGYDAYLFPTEKLNAHVKAFALNDGYKFQIAETIDTQRDISVYPEIQYGNPFGTKNVVRYIMNEHHLPHKENFMSTWEPDDFWLYYHSLFYDKIKEPNYLQVLDTRVNIFKDYGLERKHEACFTYRKKHHIKDQLPKLHPDNAVEILTGEDDELLLNIFNSCKRFYSYDTETYLNTLAALCGCESVIVPYNNITKEEVISHQSALKYGIAYGYIS